MKIEPELYYPDEIITGKDGTISAIMFLKDGEVGFAYLRRGSVLNGLVLETRSVNKDLETSCLLNRSLMPYERRVNYQIVARNYCFLLILQYEDFYEVLRQSRKDTEFYFSLCNRVSYTDQ